MVYRGNVIEVRNDSLVVILDDCTFENVKKFKGLEEGMEIYFEERDIIRKSNLKLKNIVLVAASIFLFIVTSFYGVDVWNTNYRAIALVSVDINPSVEIKVNKNHNVIKAIALNEDAKKLPLNTLKNQPLDEALEELVDMARVEGYIKEEVENYILVTSVELREDAQEEKILTDLIAEGKEKIEVSAIEAGQRVEVIAIQSNKETLKEAKKEKISVGKKEIYQNTNIKQEDDLKERMNINKERAEQLKQINKKDKYEKKVQEEIKQEKGKLKEEEKQEKQEKDKQKEEVKQDKDKVKEEVKVDKDNKKEVKKEDKNNQNEKEKEKESKKGNDKVNKVNKP